MKSEERRGVGKGSAHVYIYSMATNKLNDCFALADDGLAYAEQNIVIPFYILDFETSATDHLFC